MNKGEVLGFAGLLGSGRTELARLLYGADKPDRGDVTMHGKKVSLHSPVSGLSQPHRVLHGEPSRRRHRRGPVGAREPRARRTGPTRVGAAAVQAREGRDRRQVHVRARRETGRPGPTRSRTSPAATSRRFFSGGGSPPALSSSSSTSRPEVSTSARRRRSRRQVVQLAEARDLGGLHLIRARGSGQAQRPHRRDEGPPQGRRDHRRPGRHRADRSSTSSPPRVTPSDRPRRRGTRMSTSDSVA